MQRKTAEGIGMSHSTEAERTLLEARRRGDPDEIAEALAVHANALMQEGQLSLARQSLDEAATVHRERGRPYDEARCTQFAATLCRLEGNLSGAYQRVTHAARLAGEANPLAVSVATELGEIALAEGKAQEAAAAYTRAITQGTAAGLIDSAQAALLRKRAIALVRSGRHQEAAQDLDIAYALLVQAGEHSDAIRTLVEQATALQEGGRTTQAEQVITQATQAARQAQDDHALADLCLLQSAQAIQRHAVTQALALAEQARSHALAAVAPVSYLSAAVAIAELADASGDRQTAYESLAVGWVTLADLLGRQAAREAFEPRLLDLRQRWGETSFNEVKTTYETHRRRALGRGK